MNPLVQQYIDRLVSKGQAPGVQYACSDSTGLVQGYAAGWASISPPRPMTNCTPLMAYSISKLITAEAVSLLARQGRLRLDDPIEAYVPSQPYHQIVTIRHLLEHTSGMPNPIPLRWVHLASEDAQFDEKAVFEDVWRQYPRLQFAPGAKTRYSNLGYWLLGKIIEAVAKQPFVSFVEQMLLRPLDISRTDISYRFPEDHSQASGYLERCSVINLLRPFLTGKSLSGECQGKWILINDHYVNGPSFGGAIGTAMGFSRFALNLFLKGEAGFGWNKQKDFYQKEGGGAGFHSILRLYPQQQRVAAFMSNSTNLNVAACIEEIQNLG